MMPTGSGKLESGSGGNRWGRRGDCGICGRMSDSSDHPHGPAEPDLVGPDGLRQLFGEQTVMRHDARWSGGLAAILILVGSPASARRSQNLTRDLSRLSPGGLATVPGVPSR
jgi:hypothetical protein